MLKKIALHDTHVTLGAKMVPFAGFHMPIQYEGIKIEHQTVRENVGVFDVSHMGEFLLEGPRALELIQFISANDASKLTVGKAQYSYMPNDKGGIVDDFILYKIKKETYLLVVNASNIEKDWHWIKSHNTMGVNMKNLSDNYSLLAIQGPKSIEAMQPVTSIDLKKIDFYNFVMGDFCGIPEVIISATGYTGSGGFEIYCKQNEVKQIWDKIFEVGAIHNIKPIGLAARDSLRLEMGYCLYGNDIDDTTSPLEAGLGWVTKFTKKFLNSEALQKQKENGITKKLVGFEMKEKGIPRKDYNIVEKNGNLIGKVSSGTMSPTLGKGIGLGYIKKEFSPSGSNIFIDIRKKKVAATVVKLPFYKG